MFISENVKKLVNHIKTKPEEWKQTVHTFDHRKSGTRIWTSNGFLCIDFCPEQYTFNLTGHSHFSNDLIKLRV